MKLMMSVIVLALLNLSGCTFNEKQMAPAAPEHDDKHGVVITQEQETNNQDSGYTFKIPIM